ncbi:unnamed protein product [Caenorhabditis brenneri]
MSLSRPARFPLLKLPLLCIEGVVRSWDYFDIIFFALTSKKARRVVKNLMIRLNGIQICLLKKKWITLGSMCKTWYFENCLKWCFDRNSRRHPLVLEKNTSPLYTSKTDYDLESYFEGNEFIAPKMAMEFLTDVFKCSTEKVKIYGDNFPESGDIGFKSTVNLDISQNSLQPFGYAQSQKLNLLLETLEVTGTCHFCMNLPFGFSSTEKGFYVDPKLFKCKTLVFESSSGAWITREILLQLEVPRLSFYHCPFSVEDILSFVTNWFHSDNKKLEYLYISIQSNQISLEKFQTKELNPVPFSERTRVPSSEYFRGIDFSKGLEIVRHDGLIATIHVTKRVFLFYIWHDQSAITQN